MQQKSNGFIKHFFQLGFGTLISMMIGVFATPVITRIVEPAIYGQFSLINSYASIGMAILTLGLDQALMRYYYMKEDMNYKKRCFHICFALPLIIAIVTCLSLSLICLILNDVDTDFSALIGYISVIAIAMLLDKYSFILLRLQYKTKLYSALNVLKKLVYLALSMFGLLVIKNYYLQVLIVALAVSNLAGFIIVYIKEHKFYVRVPVKKDKDINIKVMVKYGFPLMISTSVMTLFHALDRFCLNFFCDYSTIGVYASAQTLVHVFSLIQTSFNTIWAPTAIQHYERDNNDTSYYKRMNDIITVVMFAFGATILAFKDVFVLLLGESYREAATIIPYLLFNPIMYTISETTIIGVYFKKKTSNQLYITVLSLVTNFVLNMILIPLMGAKGAAVSTGISYIVFFSLRTYFANKCFPVKYNLRQFYAVTILFTGLATYHMYNHFGVICLILYVAYIAVLGVLYKETCFYLISIVKSFLRNIRKKIT